MRLTSVVLGSTALLALTTATMVTAQAALAQVVPAGKDLADFATHSPAAASPVTTGEAASNDAIVVTGLRRSIQSAQTIKRNSVQIVDSIVAEDIGKLPDVAVSDTAARIVGVQVELGGGEASRVFVRGLPDFTTTHNNREIFYR